MNNEKTTGTARANDTRMDKAAEKAARIAAAKEKAKAARQFTTVDVTNDGLQDHDWLDGSIVGVVVSAKLVNTVFEGTRRPRSLVVLQDDDDGTKTNVWLPESHHEGMHGLRGSLVRISRTGEGKLATRYHVEVAT